MTTAVRIALICALAAAALGLAPDSAQAAYSARVDAGTLIITGDAASDKLALRLQPGSPATLDVDVGDDGTADASFDRSTFTAIDVASGPGADEVRIDQSFGAFFDELVTIDGGPGDDMLRGGSGEETFHGGPGDDVVAGGDANDHAFLGSGDDSFVWNPGDDSDTVEGEAGNDVLQFNGSGAPELMEASADGQRVRFTRNVASIVMDLNGTERLAIRALGGTDAIIVGDLGGTDLEAAEIDLASSAGGGDGQVDSVIARGTSGADDVEFASPEEAIEVDGLAATTRVTGSEAMDDVTAQTLAGEDTIDMGLGVSVPATLNADGGEGADTATYDGSAAADMIAVVANGAEVSISAGMTARFDTLAIESLVVRGLGEADTITGTGNLAALTAITMEGGEGGDTLRGGNGADLLIGGAGDDFIDGNQGQDQALMGGGDDRFQWDPGDGNDTVEGQSGRDLLDFFGSGAAESMQASADGKRVRFSRNVGNIVMNLDGVERLAVHALGSADTITIDDLRGTDLDDVDVDLAAVGGGGDGQPDTVITNGGDRKDKVQVNRSGAELLVAGFAAQTRIGGSEAANDTLRVQTFGGNDDVTVAPDASGLIATAVDLGADE